MASLPNDIWHLVSKHLINRPKDLYNFFLTSRGAEDIIGKSGVKQMKLWGPIFKEFDKIFYDYDWVESVESRGLIPILIIRDKKASYIDLHLSSKEIPWKLDRQGRRFKSISFGNCDETWSKQQIEGDKEIVFDKILQSLHYDDALEARDQIKFPTFTLSLRGVLACPGFVPDWDFAWAMGAADGGSREIEIVVFGHGKFKIKGEPQSGLLQFLIPGFEPIYYMSMYSELGRNGRLPTDYQCSLPTGNQEESLRRILFYHRMNPRRVFGRNCTVPSQ